MRNNKVTVDETRPSCIPAMQMQPESVAVVTSTEALSQKDLVGRPVVRVYGNFFIDLVTFDVWDKMAFEAGNVHVRTLPAGSKITLTI